MSLNRREGGAGHEAWVAAVRAVLFDLDGVLEGLYSGSRKDTWVPSVMPWRLAKPACTSST